MKTISLILIALSLFAIGNLSGMAYFRGKYLAAQYNTQVEALKAQEETQNALMNTDKERTAWRAAFFSMEGDVLMV